MAICTDSTEGTIIMSRQNHQKGAHDSIILTAICNDNTKGTSGGYKGAQQQLLCASKHLAQQSAYTDTHTHTQPRCRHKYMPEGTGNTISLHTQTYARTHAAMCADTRLADSRPLHCTAWQACREQGEQGGGARTTGRAKWFLLASNIQTAVPFTAPHGWPAGSKGSKEVGHAQLTGQN
eukprot:1161303-Pelagomonas_calceolata.AAC.6